LEYANIDDGIIFKVLFKEGEINYNKLFLAVSKYMSRPTFDSHIRILKESGYLIHRREGQYRYFSLSDNIKWALEARWPVILQSKREHRTIKNHSNLGKIRELDKKEKVVRIYFLILFLAAFGSMEIKPTGRSMAKLGDFMLQTKGKKLRPYRSNIVVGVSESDMRKKYRDIGFAWKFKDIRFTTYIEYFDILRKYNSPLIEPLKEMTWTKQYSIKNPEARYSISERRLRDFFMDCMPLLDQVINMMKVIWKYKSEPTYDEIRWYEFFHGKKEANKFFNEINDIRSKQSNEQVNKRIEIMNCSINAYAYYCILSGDAERVDDRIVSRVYLDRTEKYARLHKDKVFKIITDYILRKVYPKFASDIHLMLTRHHKK
jgi:DNA-binding transcriptional ArsR family regulator